MALENTVYSNDKLEGLNAQVVDHNSHRRHFDRTPSELALQIVEEAHELVAEIEESLLTGNAFLVAGEIGDLYLLLAQLCSDIGINPADAVQMKLLRNTWKYPDYVMNNGYSGAQARTMSKEVWKEYGGDQRFSHLYLDMLVTDD